MTVSGPSGLSFFVAAALILAVTPGPAVLYIVTRSVSQGRGAGIVSCTGVACGGLAHVAAAAFGLSAILAASATAFSLVKYAGAAYLVWLGVRKFADPSVIQDVDVVAPHSLVRVFREGVIVNVLNPKTALFFLAFLPQFVVPARGSVSGQFLLLGMVFVAIAFRTDTSWPAGEHGPHLAEAGIPGRLRRSAMSRAVCTLVSGWLRLSRAAGGSES
jgi:threonine/homoserine/homoserine lactone efflux protein